MMWPVYLCDNARAEIGSADHPWLRLARAAHAYADEPREDVGVDWWVCSPDTVATFGATAYYFGRELKDRGCAVAVVDISWGGSSVEAWMSRDVLRAIPAFAPRLAYAERIRADYEKNRQRLDEAKSAHAENLKAAAERGAPAAFAPNPDYRQFQHHWPSGLYNSIIYPLRHARFRGVAFYQGETNAVRAAQYRELFPAMIRDWRDTFEQGDFPFVFVQLAGFKLTEEEPQESAWAEMREAQSFGLREPNTAMVLAIDIGDRRNIHPTNKQALGKRLGLAAKRLAYGEDVVARGPYVQDVTFAGGQAVVTLGGCEGGDLLLLGDPYKTFAIAGEDGRFWWADVSIEGNRVELTSPMVDEPAAVRYNWSDYPLGFLYNAAGLPAEPFRTDDRPGLTDGRW
jgi:sialate O-acetylesterase